MIKGTTMSEQRRSGFAQFLDDGKRDDFVRDVLVGDSLLTGRAYLSGSRPTIVFDNLTDSEQRKVACALEGIGRWVEDVQFEATG